MKPTDSNSKVRCSFCGKEARDVRKLIAGPKVHICDECVSLCREIIEEDKEREPKQQKGLDEMRPKEIKAFLDEHMVGQHRAKRVISVAVYNHYKRIMADDLALEMPDMFDEEDDEVELTKGNILMIGPTGSGKTMMAQSLAKKLDVPFTIADATSLTEAGYVGEDVENVIKNLWLAADRDVERASRGIVCIDEIDKIAKGGSSPSATRDVGGEGVQQALLKMVESSEVMITPEGSRNRPQQEFIQVDTSNILFICCGSFDGLTEIISRRMGEQQMGFGSELKKKDENTSEILKFARPHDLVKFGLIPEFVGRFPVIVTFDELSEDMLVDILWQPKNSLVKQYQKLFEMEGVKLRFQDEAMVAIVREAIKRKTGARGLRSILEEVMLDVMYELPSLRNVRECVITEEVLTKKEKPMLVYEKKSA
ncbi:ATP-dependent Clp protease ATP-binding subunit ClpX [Persicimonas caeni]|uniref:ATP-dependent Clp protease ATP-binding subunit ClpX n=1 Tax=Persicimonas caeni TaxID=2292766 RepID=A0A4Y6PSD3_PERCE|nr:ATP-dependent Clp protease ATP-binding subunit ClpX [Persicimonas caeni]QDG51231.1 ATP-dependent Clp protease ATP-binding subunit ClpX [Persicimonas caeni]QED32452.1 ATP-dependent Clp protease ATP-binding subunit ClpX [Persicimonas caeni]